VRIHNELQWLAMKKKPTDTAKSDPKNNNKVRKNISISPEIEEMLNKQAKANFTTASAYLTSLVLERESKALKSLPSPSDKLSKYG
jgi:hypothetical protein